MTDFQTPDSPKIDAASVDQFHTFLMGGKPPKGISVKHKPKLTPQQAFAVIYVLQEHFHFIPDCFEMCCHCYRIFDTEREGRYSESSGKNWCGDCEESE